MNVLYFIILLPLLGFVFSIFVQNGKFKKQVSTISIASLGIATIFSILEKLIFFRNKKSVMIVTVLNWINIKNFNIPVTFVLDDLSMIMVLLILLIGFLVCLYSTWYMKKEKNYTRFFLYINLFTTGMLILVLTNNLLIMYLGMELIGFCSYFLIGFYYKNVNSGKVATKSFIFTKIGDMLILFSIFIFYSYFGTLNYNKIILPEQSSKKPIELIIAMFALLIGLMGKSAQIPLHTWLADAMSGPTPASALIHASTMVTSGVYLIVRLRNLFSKFSEILIFIEIISIAIIILSSLSAFLQTDIKRILAYSTISQIGYMFLSISICDFNIAIYHLFVHAFFKSLLFLSSGSISAIFKGERNINKIGGTKRHFPFVNICFLIGSASLSAFPIITSSFYSKDEILFHLFMNGHIISSMFGFLGSFLTSIYVSRMVFFVLFKKSEINIDVRYFNKYRKFNHYFPLVILLLFSSLFGKWIFYYLMNGFEIYNFEKNKKLVFLIISSMFSIFGYLFFFFYIKNTKLILLEKPKNYFLFQLFFRSFCFDILYKKIFIKPYILLINILKSDPINKLTNYTLRLLNYINNNLIKMERREFLICTHLIAIWSVFVTAILLFNYLKRLYL